MSDITLTTFADQSGNVPASELDGNFTALQTAIDVIREPIASTGTATAYVIAYGATSYTINEIYSFTPNNANTGACTADFGPGATSIKLRDGTDPAANDILATIPPYLRYDGTNLVLINPQSSVELIGAAKVNGDSTQQFSVKAASATGQAVQWDQVQNAVPVHANNSTTGTSVSCTTGTFTAPCDGYLIIFGFGPAGSTATNAVSLTASLAGLVVTSGGYSAGDSLFVQGYLPITSGQSTTVTMTMGALSSISMAVEITAFFLPSP